MKIDERYKDGIGAMGTAWGGYGDGIGTVRGRNKKGMGTLCNRKTTKPTFVALTARYGEIHICKYIYIYIHVYIYVCIYTYI